MTQPDTMTLLVDLGEIPGAAAHQQITLFGRLLATRPSWSGPVELGEAVQLDRGEFSRHCPGRTPLVGGVAGVVVQVADVPAEVAWRALADHPDLVRIADRSLVDHDVLVAERDRLRRRLAAVDALLALEDA